MSDNESIIIMSKYPFPGSSKTRLGRYIGYEKSAIIAKSLLDDTLDISRMYTDNVYISCPKKDEKLFGENYPDIDLLSSQKSSGCMHDSVISLETVFNETLSNKAAIISPDTPAFDISFFSKVFEELDKNRYVAGFNRDKKPYMLGLNRKFAESKQKSLLKNLPNNFTNIVANSAYYFFRRPFFKVYREKETIDIDTCRDLADVAQKMHTNYKRTDYIISEYTKSEDFVFDLCSGIAKECGFISSNMPVSALAIKDNEIVSSGHRFETGFGKHAEHCMIEKAGSNIKNSDVFVTLEPCTNRIANLMKGCAHKLAESGVKKVIFGKYDMNPKTKGVEELEQLDIECFHSPVFERRINHYMSF